MKQTKSELNRFILSGIMAVLTDLSIYYVLINYLDFNLAKGISFVSGTFVAFIANKYFTFRKYNRKAKEIWQFCLLYSFTLTINVTVNKILLSLSEIIFISFIIATGISAMINFIGQKFWVFK